MQTNTRPKAYVSTDPSLFDSEITIVIKELPPKCPFTLHSCVTVGKDLFECIALYFSDVNGEIDLSQCKSMGGFYKGVEPMGLFWALQALTKNKTPKRLLKKDVMTPMIVKIKIYDGWFESVEKISANAELSLLKEFQVTRIFVAPGVTREEIKKDGLIGVLFLPPGEGLFPGIINMFGGFPGTLEFKAALFASHGFAALALPFYGIEGLPKTLFHIELEYFEKAVEFMLSHKKIKRNPGIGVVGVCKGGEITLCMADCLRGIKCVVAINCSIHSSHNSYSYRDKKWKATEVDSNCLSYGKNSAAIFRGCFHTYKLEDPEFTSRMFNFHKRPNTAILYIAGLNDDDVCSEFYANQAEKLLKSAEHPKFEILRYAGAGHLLESPYIPLCEYSYTSAFGMCAQWGGCAVAHCRAQEDSWHRQLKFLHRNLAERHNLTKL